MRPLKSTFWWYDGTGATAFLVVPNFGAIYRLLHHFAMLDGDE